MTWFERFLYFLNGNVPKKYGKRIRIGLYYDTYYNKETEETWVFEKSTCQFLERK